jgi:hypothetical protein
LPARWCQPVVAGAVIYADLRGKLSTHLALQALFTQSSPVREPLLQAFPFLSTLGKVTCTQFLRPACLFTVHVDSGSSPLSCAVFLPPPLLQAFLLLITGRCCCSCQPPCSSPVAFSSLCHPHKLSRSWLLGSHPHSHRSLSCPPGLFIYSSGKDSLPPIFSAQCTPPSFPCVFIVLIAY